MPLVWIAHRAARTNFNPRQRRLQAGAAIAAASALLALALARPVISEPIVARVDRLRRRRVAQHRHAARSTTRRSASTRSTPRSSPAHSRIVAFGATSRAAREHGGAARASRRPIPTARSRGADASTARGTDLEAALDAARGELARRARAAHRPVQRRPPTAGDVHGRGRPAGRGAASRSSVEPMAVRTLGDTLDRRASTCPARLTAGAHRFPSRSRSAASAKVDARVELRVRRQACSPQQTAHLAKGSTRVSLDAVIDAPGATTLEASVDAGAAIRLPRTTRCSRGVWVDAAGPRALRRRHAGERALPVVRADRVRLRRHRAGRPGTAVHARGARSPTTSSCSATSIARRCRRRRWPRSPTGSSSGGGLLVAGGDAVFGEGAGGYRKTTLERLTPVTFERKDEPSVALILVLDRSWSMAGTSMDLCKAAAQAAVDVMTDEQSLGVLTFNDKFDWDVTLRNVGKNRDAIRQKIAAIEPGGRTLIFPALEQAYLALRNVKARAKHVVLLSDGRTYPDDYEGAGQEDDRRADHGVVDRRRPVRRPGAAAQHREVGQGARLHRRRRRASCRRSSSRKPRTRRRRRSTRRRSRRS